MFLSDFERLSRLGLTPKRNHILCASFVTNVFQHRKTEGTEITPKRNRTISVSFAGSCAQCSSLNQHVKNHAKERPYRCDFYQKCFSRSEN